MEKEKPKNKSEFVLMNAIGFSEDDLQANRDGKLSETQKKALLKQHRQLLEVGIFRALPVIALLLLPLLAIATAWFPLSLVCATASIPLLIAIFLDLFAKASLYRQDANDTVSLAEGRVLLDIKDGDKHHAYRVHLEANVFFVTKSIFLAFKNGDPYVIYYTPRTKTILSAEWLYQQEIR